MTTILEKTSFENSLISDLNLEQVVSLLLNVNSESSIFLELKNQLLSKGLDNIYERINVKKVINDILTLSKDELSTVRDKVLPLFLELETIDPYHDKKVISLLKKKYLLALKEYNQNKLVDAEVYLKKSIGA